MKTSWLPYFENPKPGLTPEDLGKLERQVGITFPHSLRELYGTLGGGRFRFRLFVDAEETFYNIHELIPAKATGVDPGFAVECQDLLKRRLIPEHLVIFAVESGGNYYCVDRGDESVWYADMELGIDGLLPPPKRIAESLDAFLRAGQAGEG